VIEAIKMFFSGDGLVDGCKCNGIYKQKSRSSAIKSALMTIDFMSID